MNKINSRETNLNLKACKVQHVPFDTITLNTTGCATRPQYLHPTRSWMNIQLPANVLSCALQKHYNS